MTILTWLVGAAIVAWVGTMGIGALLHTKSAQAWFGDMLKQSPIVIRLNGFGLTVAAIVVLLDLLQPTLVNQTALMWALVGLGIAQVVSLVMQIIHQAARSALAGPIVLLALIGAFWYLRIVSLPVP